MSATLSVFTLDVPLFFDRSVTVFVISVSPSSLSYGMDRYFPLVTDRAVQKKLGVAVPRSAPAAAPSLIRVNSHLMVPETSSAVCLLLDTEYYRSTIHLH